MTLFATPSITKIETDAAHVHAFKISRHIDDDASEALAKHMNDVFDRHGEVNMLFDLTEFTGRDWDTMLDGDVITSRFRPLSHVSRYAVIGAPEKATKMIRYIDKVISVETKAFDAKNSAAVWMFVGATPNRKT